MQTAKHNNKKEAEEQVRKAQCGTLSAVLPGTESWQAAKHSGRLEEQGRRAENTKNFLTGWRSNPTVAIDEVSEKLGKTATSSMAVRMTADEAEAAADEAEITRRSRIEEMRKYGAANGEDEAKGKKEEDAEAQTEKEEVIGGLEAEQEPRMVSGRPSQGICLAYITDSVRPASVTESGRPTPVTVSNGPARVTMTAIRMTADEAEAAANDEEITRQSSRGRAHACRRMKPGRGQKHEVARREPRESYKDDRSNSRKPIRGDAPQGGHGHQKKQRGSRTASRSVATGKKE